MPVLRAALSVCNVSSSTVATSFDPSLLQYLSCYAGSAQLRVAIATSLQAPVHMQDGPVPLLQQSNMSCTGTLSAVELLRHSGQTSGKILSIRSQSFCRCNANSLPCLSWFFVEADPFTHPFALHVTKDGMGSEGKRSCAYTYKSSAHSLCDLHTSKVNTISTTDTNHCTHIITITYTIHNV